MTDPPGDYIDKLFNIKNKSDKYKSQKDCFEIFEENR